jgi:hypothetical protein
VLETLLSGRIVVTPRERQTYDVRDPVVAAWNVRWNLLSSIVGVPNASQLEPHCRLAPAN